MNDHETFLLLAAKQIGERLSDQEEAELSAHLAACPSCRATAAAMRRDDILLRGELGVVPVSPRVRRRVMDQASGVRRIDWRTVLALAATLVVAGAGATILGVGGRPSSTSPLAAIASPSPTVEASSTVRSASVSPSVSASPEASPSSSPGASWSVDGAYEYGKTPPKRDTIAAHLEAGRPAGEWSRRQPALPPSESFGGPITCLVVDGNDAWMAGPATTATDGSKDRAAMIYVHDGGKAGEGDKVVLWLSTPGETITTMEQWCERRFIPAGPFPLTSGDITVDDGT